MNILFVGDVVGRPGRWAVRTFLPGLIDRYQADFVIVNGENAAAGYGLTEKTADELFNAGADCLTSGNHIWANREGVLLVEQDPRILRPANFAPGVPGRGSGIFSARNGARIGVINLIGRIFMEPADCPFRSADTHIGALADEVEAAVVDFHAEATSEKEAMGYYLDGRAAAVIGTHTHVATADEKILPEGTAYITDCGMTGPVDSIIGAEKEIIIRRFLDGMPARFAVPKKGPAILSACLVQVSMDNGLAERIVRISLDLNMEDE